MRPVVSWITKSDDVILELLEECGIAIPPRAIAFNIQNVSRPTIDRRLPKLETAGLVDRYDNPQDYTMITDRGRAYLADSFYLQRRFVNSFRFFIYPYAFYESVCLISHSDGRSERFPRQLHWPHRL